MRDRSTSEAPDQSGDELRQGGPAQPDGMFAPIQSGGEWPGGRNPSDLAKGKSRVVVKKRVEQSSWPLLLVCDVGVIVTIALGVRRSSHRGHCFWSVVVVVCDRGLRSFEGLLVVVVEQPGSWARGFESHRGGLESV